MPVAFQWGQITMFGGGCYPGPDQNIIFSAPTVSGVSYRGIVTSVAPPGTNVISPLALTPINVGDTVDLVNGAPNSSYFPSSSGIIELALWAIGTPTTAGQVHPCTFSALWLSNLMLCPEGLSTNVPATCTVQPGATGLAEVPVASNGVQLPDASNGWILNVQDPAVRSVELINACGSVLANFQRGSYSAGALPNGLYFVRISTDAGTRTQRVVIAR